MPGVSFDSTIRENIIRRATNGIAVEGSAEISENVLLGERGTGITTSSDLLIRRNRVRAFESGVRLDGSGATVRGNDFRGNRGPDCFDSSSGEGTAGTSNTWINDLGHDSQPVGICRPY
ncbi:MAG: right-handed parallel beta-helix repeat-containing protein [Chloroflexota bacterium]|nr:right-handed parallel beta-helix repeat-containing protein [Chloroflexota bacterium]